MNPYNPNIHHRRSIRLKGYDYTNQGLYFITICCQNRAHLFGIVVDREMKLNTYGKIAHDEWQNTEKIRNNCQIHDFIIMPDHMHGIIEITHQKTTHDEIGQFKSPSQTIGAMIRGYKIATIKKIKDSILSSSKQESAVRANCNSPKKENSIHSPQSNLFPTKMIKSLDFKIWQRNYWEHIIRDEKSYHRIATYIQDNPKNYSK